MVSRKSEKDWTSEHISSFWKWQNATPSGQEAFFSRKVGEVMVNFLQITGHLIGRVLDYGCGPGYLLNYLLQKDLDCYGLDFSKDAVDLTNAKYRGNKRWRGCVKIDNLPTLFEHDFFDVITCIETLEHLTSGQLEAVTREIYRILKPDGIAMFTTPYAENIEGAMVYCPFCDSEFHKWQHFRSFDKDSLEAVLKAIGFKVLFCRNVNLGNFQKNYTSSSRRKSPYSYIYRLRDLYNGWKNRLNRLLDMLSKTRFPYKREITKQSGKGPHLCAIVIKRS